MGIGIDSSPGLISGFDEVKHGAQWSHKVTQGHARQKILDLSQCPSRDNLDPTPARAVTRTKTFRRSRCNFSRALFPLDYYFSNVKFLKVSRSTPKLRSFVKIRPDAYPNNKVLCKRRVGKMPSCYNGASID